MTERTNEDRDPPPPASDPRLEIPEALRPRPARKAEAPPPPMAGLAGAAKAWAIAFDFIGTILAGALLGWLIDRWLGSSPWGLLGGLCLGFAGAFYRIVRATRR